MICRRTKRPSIRSPLFRLALMGPCVFTSGSGSQFAGRHRICIRARTGSVSIGYGICFLLSKITWAHILGQVGANGSNLITKTTSMGMWVPIHDDEWDGDVPLGLDRPPTPGKSSKGEVVFKGNTLPWSVGRYEVRRHVFSDREFFL